MARSVNGRLPDFHSGDGSSTLPRATLSRSTSGLGPLPLEQMPIGSNPIRDVCRCRLIAQTSGLQSRD